MNQLMDNFKPSSYCESQRTNPIRHKRQKPRVVSTKCQPHRRIPLRTTVKVKRDDDECTLQVQSRTPACSTSAEHLDKTPRRLVVVMRRQEPSDAKSAAVLPRHRKQAGRSVHKGSARSNRCEQKENMDCFRRSEECNGRPGAAQTAAQQPNPKGKRQTANRKRTSTQAAPSPWVRNSHGSQRVFSHAGLSTRSKRSPGRMSQRYIPAQPKPEAVRNQLNRSCDSTKIPNAPFLKCFKEKVALSQDEICKTSEIVNTVVPDVLEEVRKNDPRFAIRILNAGSYYEHLKVSRPSEFDIMLVLDAHLIQRFFKVRCPSTARELVGYAQLEFQDKTTNGRNTWGEFLTQDGKFLAPHKVRNHFYELLRKAVVVIKRKRRQRFLNLKRNGPAATMVIDGRIEVDLVLSIKIIGWPQCANGWGNFASSRSWPTQRQVEQIKMKEPKYHLIAKSCPFEDIPEHSQKNWRVSFSEAEKALLRPKDPAKKYYRIAKLIFETHASQLKPLSSYHLKTLFLRRRHDYPRIKTDDSNLGERVVQFLESLACCLKERSLRHFFISRLDLLAQISDAEKENVGRRLKIFISKLVGNPEMFLEDLLT